MRKIINILITLVLGFIIYYITLPAINLNNFGFYAFIAFLVFIYAILDSLSSFNSVELFKKGKKVNLLKDVTVTDNS